MRAQFEKGDEVALKVDETRRGTVTAVLDSVGGQWRYRVFHTASEQRVYDEDQLIPAPTPLVSEQIVRALAEYEFVDADSFRARMTAMRLANPLTDNLYSLWAARVAYIPFQFKPLLRFLRADRPRLLIADEVGVGKTIEAGLVMRELQARQDLQSVLIVCPKELSPKWRMEMQRFDEEFRILNSGDLAYCLEQTHLEREWPYTFSRTIIPLELLRQDHYLWGSEQPRRAGIHALQYSNTIFDLLIIDEAHHLRNRETNSHKAAHMLVDISDAVLFLSATPVHTGSDDLFNLLNMLRDDLVPDEAVFYEMLEPGVHVNRAIQILRRRTEQHDWQVDVANAIGAAIETKWGRRVLATNREILAWHSRLAVHQVVGDQERIDCLRAIEAAHPFAYIINRTRRRDIGQFTVREPRTVTVDFTPQQQAFYDNLVRFRYDVMRRLHNPQVARLALDVVERQASSCLPALLPVLDQFIATGRFSLTTVSDIDEFPQAEIVASDTELQEQAEQLRSIVRNLPAYDPKLEQLISIIEHALNSDGPRKLLVFSFFLGTLGYLHEKLTAANYRVGLVTGLSDDEERADLRTRFRLAHEEPAALDILLSSEVGCEGLDYEFCDRLVNYDLPWNPMRIEQRIGRIDRFGQQSDKILIYNFITPGTVEERIFYRCYERLGIFHATVGDLDAVLGELVRELNLLAVDTQLTHAQAEARARQLADSALNQLATEHELERESGHLLSLDYLTTDSDELIDQGRFVAPAELQHAVHMFLENIGGGMTVDGSGLSRIRLAAETRAELGKSLRNWSRSGRDVVEFEHWLSGRDPYLSVTFDQETAVANRSVPFVTPVHPLARLAVSYWEDVETPAVANLSTRHSSLTPGLYVYALFIWESRWVKPETQLVGFACSLSDGSPANEVGEILASILPLVENTDSLERVEGNLLTDRLQQLEDMASHARRQTRVVLQEKNDRLIEQRLASLEASLQARLQRIDEELQLASDERIQRMRQGERDRVIRSYETRRDQILQKRKADVFSELIAAGLLEITR